MFSSDKNYSQATSHLNWTAQKCICLDVLLLYCTRLMTEFRSLKVSGSSPGCGPKLESVLVEVLSGLQQWLHAFIVCLYKTVCFLCGKKCTERGGGKHSLHFIIKNYFFLLLNSHTSNLGIYINIKSMTCENSTYEPSTDPSEFISF